MKERERRERGKRENRKKRGERKKEERKKREREKRARECPFTGEPMLMKAWSKGCITVQWSQTRDLLEIYVVSYVKKKKNKKHAKVT